MNRRPFPRRYGIVLAILLVSTTFWGCGSNDEDPGEPSLLFTSSVEAGHSHELVLRVDEIDDPPASGLNRETSPSSDHTHIVILTVEDLERIGNGETVTRTTTEVGGHTHTFTLRRP